MTLDEALENAARDLPEGFMVSVSAEKGAGWVDLYSPDGQSVNFDTSPDKSLAEQVCDAVIEAGSL